MNRKTNLKSPTSDSDSMNSEKNYIKTVQIDHLRHIDELFALQHVIRRFKLHHQADFDKLLALRNELSEILRKALPKKNRVVFSSHLFERCLWSCILFIEKKENRIKLERNSVRWTKELLIKELDAALKVSSLFRVESIDVTSLVNTMAKFCPDISEINHRLNYTHFCSLLGLTSYVSGEQLFMHYINAKLGKDRITRRGVTSTLINEEALWLFSEKSERDENLSVLIRTPCRSPKHISKNIRIFGGEQHLISVNKIPLENSLILSIPTDQIPDNIDDALRELRNALMAEYMNKFGLHKDIDSKNYLNSMFNSRFTHNGCLLKDWDQVQSQITGLWSWDISNEKRCSIEDASGKVNAELDRIKKHIRHGLPIYKDDTIRGHHLNTNKLIGSSNSKKKLAATKVDHFYTRTQECLGANNSSMK